MAERVALENLEGVVFRWFIVAASTPRIDMPVYTRYPFDDTEDELEPAFKRISFYRTNEIHVTDDFEPAVIYRQRYLAK